MSDAVGILGPFGTPDIFGTLGILGTPDAIGTAGALVTPGPLNISDDLGIHGPFGIPDTIGTAGAFGTPDAIGTAGAAVTHYTHRHLVFITLLLLPACIFARWDRWSSCNTLHTSTYYFHYTLVITRLFVC